MISRSPAKHQIIRGDDYIYSMQRFLLFLLIFISSFSVKAQTDSCHLRVSLLTCSPGEELYSTFGHSALRVTDSLSGYDIIFNYGTFDFNDPDFYMKFVRGKLLYFVSVQDYNGFRSDYAYERRSIIEQELVLTCKQKQQLYLALQENLKEENKYYKYDFLFDNCSTRLGDIVQANSDGQVKFNSILGNDPPTFRELLHVYLRNGEMYWSKLGIDILLGSKIDREVTSREAMFLPDFLMKGFDSATVSNQKLVAEKATVLSVDKPAKEESILTRPIVITSLLMIIVGVLQFSKRKWAVPVLQVFDRVFFFLSGALGVLLLFMWFGTEHAVCAENYNLLWAIPFHLVLAFLPSKKRYWVSRYFMVMAAWYFILFFAWALLPQDMNTAIVPIVIIAFMRSVVLYRKNL